MIFSTFNFKTKILVALILVFAGVIDLFLGELILNTSIGIAPILLALAIVFILQDSFKWVRISLLILMASLLIYRLCLILLDIVNSIERIFRAMIQPATIPLYGSLLFIGILTFLIVKTNLIIQHHKE